MKTIKKDLNAGTITFRIEVADDFFYLADIIGKGDKVTAMTKRRVEVHNKGDVHRSERIDKKPMLLTIEVDEVEFDLTVDRLRVLGKITEGPEDVPAGDFHTLNLQPGMTITIAKTWNSSDFALISDASKTITSTIMLVAIDTDYCSLGILKNYGVKLIGNLSTSLSGKDEAEQRESEEKKFFSDVLGAIRNQKVLPDKIIIAGPGFAKEDFIKFAKDKDPEVAGISIAESVSIAGEKGLQEIVKRGIIEKLVKESKFQDEVNLLTKFFEEMNKDSGLATYGSAEVRKAAESGAVETLFVSNKFLREAKIKKDTEIESMIKLVQDTKGKILIVSGEHDFGKQLEGIGGVAALNRYKFSG